MKPPIEGDHSSVIEESDLTAAELLVPAGLERRRRIEASAIEADAEQLGAGTNVDVLERTSLRLRVGGFPPLLQKWRLRAIHHEEGVELAIPQLIEGGARAVDADQLLPFGRMDENMRKVGSPLDPGPPPATRSTVPASGSRSCGRHESCRE